MYSELMKRSLYNKIIDGLDPDKSISYETYLNILSRISEGQHEWPLPRRIEIRKNFSKKKRVVYAYPVEEMFILRAVNEHLCTKYQRTISFSYFPSRKRTPSQCLSFILGRKEAYKKTTPRIGGLHGIHMDISDYFNSMDPIILFERMPEELKNDRDFATLYKNTILNPWCEQGGKLIKVEKKGAMAGLPFTAFFAAIYLNNLDNSFEKENVPYARYSDDIVFFAEDKLVLTRLVDEVKKHISVSNLTMNDEKTEFIDPNSPWTFIGFEINKNEIDISVHQYEKLKRRISKWARRYRKRVEVGYGKDNRHMTPEKAVASLIRNINRALFKPIKDKYCWAQWAFPTITVTKRIKALDEIIQEKLRFVYSGNYSKVNFKKLPYIKLKEMGYNSLEKLYILYRYKPDEFQKFLDGYVLLDGRKEIMNLE